MSGVEILVCTIRCSLAGAVLSDGASREREHEERFGGKSQLSSIHSLLVPEP